MSEKQTVGKEASDAYTGIASAVEDAADQGYKAIKSSLSKSMEAVEVAQTEVKSWWSTYKEPLVSGFILTVIISGLLYWRYTTDKGRFQEEDSEDDEDESDEEDIWEDKHVAPLSKKSKK
ncbi:uncharacterized protein LOC111714761 isoform X2 [Eurytemora carolleeae]|uniref:uncharacterized protein LOC111714761 isoform X2 n=1 Tax=Eurytemora carolleeae TaxID=1294199 RepID=UPI000C78DA8F|nr:uncharacterized protein LOC111714761 isoform X2 [Eurytemora carolleeae]|eukprot:XP_023345738.1 uncharacterized protein LOC111714761 isoform X2 [Eurytemora affinis]